MCVHTELCARTAILKYSDFSLKGASKCECGVVPQYAGRFGENPVSIFHNSSHTEHRKEYNIIPTQGKC